MTGQPSLVYVSHIDGASCPAGQQDVPLVAPESGEQIGTIREAGAAGVEAAVSAASTFFRANRSSPVHQRITWLQICARALAGASEELAQLIREDVGKPIRVARFEIKRGIEFIEACAAALPQIMGEVLPLDSVVPGTGRIGFTRHVPYGIVAGITPFNAPVNLLVQKAAPAIAAGNAFIGKPAPAGTRTALRLAELFVEAGFPRGLFNIVTGDRETAAALAGHKGVSVVSFTGGTEGGQALARIAGAKKFLAELGSNAANIVLADADVADAAQKIAGAAFEASGQQCISAQRVLVDRAILDEFLPLFTKAAAALRVGSALDPATDVGPMVSAASAARVMGFYEDAMARGARAVLEPQRNGAIVSPGIFVDVPRDARLWCEEVFGPLAVVVPFDGVDEALELANDSPFGLQGAVFTQSLRHAMRFADDFDVGALWINEASRFRLDAYPFGGMKQSGVGREGVRYAIAEYSQVKFIGMRP
ncbi:MAG: aldehyde dehydrogenase [Hyphomicrobiales bacterium]|nr:aldehyde dehydrogenase [Hyphomicrobiales bacterium]